MFGLKPFEAVHIIASVYPSEYHSGKPALNGTQNGLKALPAVAYSEIHMPITQPKINALLKQAKQQARELVESDGTVPGLSFKVSPTGTGTWFLRYRLAGAQKKVHIRSFANYREARPIIGLKHTWP